MNYFFESLRLLDGNRTIVWRVMLALLLLSSGLVLAGRGIGESACLAQEGVYDWSQGRLLAPGVRLVRAEVQQPRRMVVHGVQVDGTTPWLRLVTTARRTEWVEGKTETDRQTTRDFMRNARQQGTKMVLAVNADAFTPWPAPYNESTPSDLLGLAVADGVIVSRGSGTPSLIQTKAGSFRIAVTSRQTDTSDMRHAVSGFALCLDKGQPIDGGDVLHPRTGLGTSADGRYLVIATIDGRQPASLGATTGELGQWLRHFGADRGINMDGGGSTTLAWWNAERVAANEDPCQLLNQPVGNGEKSEKLAPEDFRPTERANGNNLGIVIDPTM